MRAMGQIHYLFTPMAADPDKLPNRLRYWRKRRGLTLEQLGDATGRTKASIGMIERGDRPLTQQLQVTFARVLNIDPADLLLAEDTPNTVPPIERDFWRQYLSLDAHGRNIVRGVAENLVNWRSQPDAEENKKQA